MIDFSLTEEEIALKKMARDFAVNEIKPIAAERDRMPNPRDCFPWDVVEKGSRLGLRTLAMPEEWGGGGIKSTRTLFVVQEELGAVGDVGVAKIFGQCWKVSRAIYELANPEQRERLLRPFIQDHRFVLSVACTEPNAGADNCLPYDAPRAGAMLLAVRTKDEYVLNGMKHFIANGGASKLYIIFGRTDPSVGVSKGLSTFLVPSDTRGFSIGKIHDKMGQRLYQQAELIFQEARIPKENLLGKEGEGLAGYRAVLRGSNAEAGLSGVSMARAAYELALQHARERVQGGKPIIEHQAVGLQLAEMCMLIEAARSLVWKAAWGIDNPDQFDPKIPALAKVFGSEVGVKVAKMAMEIFGGYGYMKDGPMEKLYRDAAYALHVDGTNTVILLRAVSQL